MDSNITRLDTQHSSDRVQLIERGHLVLRVISSQAHAAKVEATKTELEVALAEAEGGNTGFLESWLANYHSSLSQTATSSGDDAGLPMDSLIRQPSKQSVPTAPLLMDKTYDLVAKEPTRNWSSLVPHAHDRLLAIAATLETDVPAEAPTEETANDFISVENPEQEECNIFESQSLDQSLTESHADEPLEFVNISETPLRIPDKSYFRNSRGFAVSMFSHALVLGALMAFTMRQPDLVASLGFESSGIEGEVQSFELSQPIEVTAPDISPEMLSESAISPSLSMPTSVSLTGGNLNLSSSAASASSLAGFGASVSQAAATGGKSAPSRANASFFGAGSSGNCFCYVIDGSESMRGGPWEAAKSELLRSLSTMKENQRFYIIFFNQLLSEIPMPGEREPASRALYATPENLRHTRNWVETLKIARGAPPDEALQHAIELEPDAIYLLTDGVTKRDVPVFLRKVNRTSDFINGEQVRVPIHAIAFYSLAGEELMRRVAAENKGQFIYVPDPRSK